MAMVIGGAELVDLERRHGLGHQEQQHDHDRGDAPADAEGAPVGGPRVGRHTRITSLLPKRPWGRTSRMARMRHERRPEGQVVADPVDVGRREHLDLTHDQPADDRADQAVEAAEGGRREARR